MVKVGDRVTIMSGPWAGETGTVVRVNKTSVRVRLETTRQIALVGAKQKFRVR